MRKPKASTCHLKEFTYRAPLAVRAGKYLGAYSQQTHAYSQNLLPKHSHAVAFLL
jgi:hypothetical protein